jgi:hypothetical protein
MGVGDLVVYVIAFAALFFLFLIILNNWRGVFRGLALLTVGGVILAAIFVALGATIYIGTTAWEYVSDRQTMQQCLTAYERTAKAEAAPGDYFGKQLRKDAAEEAKKCADYAAKKQATDQPAK